MNEQQTTQTTPNIYDKSIALSISISRVGIRRKVASSRVAVKDTDDQPDEDAIAVSKEIIDCDEYTAIVRLDAAFRATMASLAVPAPFRRSIVLIPLDNLDRVEEKIAEYKKDRNLMVAKFVIRYPQAVLDAKASLGALYNEADYPSPADVAKQFKVTVNYLDLGVPGRLASLRPALFEREREKFAAELKNAADEVRQGLRVAFAELIGHMQDRLTPGADGKRKIFRDSLVSNLTEYLDGFDARNIADDKELADLVDKAKAVVVGKSAADLRKPIQAQEVSDALAPIKSALDSMLTDAPRRRFDFSE